MNLFAYAFMQNAFMASTFIAITTGIVGVFVVARNMSGAIIAKAESRLTLAIGKMYC